ncbi:hypothetical protein Cs7R123_06780 [Catellatospora sp. TT07R-123]|uniref:RICIN domain-containing protein n=1 Tax=Catellatospora sp. TT07R-123 TaxID=2733863 RepID=UPI001B277D68|nr:ricin-type beta-trefoil lectin domain protein [Catellatospora sp. TT07R-123]GHJ43336.1 hypothetical protein Cs7R123_06780 [Catellatospora sp. TT07R-123]
MRRSVTQFIALVGAVILGLGAVPSPAQAAASPHHIQNQANLGCLGRQGTGTIAPVATFACEDFSYQLWTPVFDSAYSGYRLYPYGSNKCLTSNPDATAAAVMLCGTSILQLWLLDDRGNGLRWLHSVSSGKCLVLGSAPNLTQAPCADAPAHLWKIWGFTG